MEREIPRSEYAKLQSLSFESMIPNQVKMENIVYFPGVSPEVKPQSEFVEQGFLAMSLDSFMAEINSMIDTANVDVAAAKPLQQGEEGNIFITSDYDNIENAYKKLEKQHPNILNILMDKVSSEAMRMQAACSHDHSKSDSDTFSSMVDELFENSGKCGGCGGEMEDGKCTKCKKSPSLLKREEVKLAA